MRISRDPSDPAFCLDRVVVEFNGVVVDDWVTADEERGLLHAYRRTPAGERQHDPQTGELRKVYRLGRVKVSKYVG